MESSEETKLEGGEFTISRRFGLGGFHRSL